MLRRAPSTGHTTCSRPTARPEKPGTPQGIMNKSRHRWSTGFTVGLFMGIVLACSGISQAEFECEDAVAHLQKCCQGLTASNINCIHNAVSGCEDSYSNNPDFDTVQSQCILNES